MRTHLLTEPEAWELMDMFFGGRTGFCYVIGRLEKFGLISSCTARDMEDRLADLPPDHDMPAYKFPLVAATPDFARMRFAREQSRILRRESEK